MPRLLARLLCIGLLIAATGARAEKIMVAAASDLKFAMDEIVANFRLHEPGHDIQVVYGSSGKFHTQIQQGAPYDLYFSADIAYPRALAKAGFAASPVHPYAVGRQPKARPIWAARGGGLAGRRGLAPGRAQARLR